MDSDLIHLIYHPAVAWSLIFASLGGMMVTLVNLRNARLWLLRIHGRQASGVVKEIEIVTLSNGEVLRRPIVAFSVEQGAEIVASPVLYRPKLRLHKGAAVQLSYARRRPTRMVVHGYDFRLREPIYAVLSLVIAIGIYVTYFKR